MDDITLTLSGSDIITIFLSFMSVLIAIAAYRITRKQLHLYLDEIYKQRILENNEETTLFDSQNIQSSTRCYIEPNCSNVDPAREAEPRDLIIIKNNIFDAVEEYLSKENPGKNAYHHILILADSGMGKTSFVLNYYVKNKRKKHNPHKIYLVPLGKKDADKFIDNIPNQKDVIIFLDALDEDQQAIKNYHKRIAELMDKCENFKRVVITSRTQFFPSDEEIPKETGIAKLGTKQLGEEGAYKFLKLYLSPFSDDQVEAYLKKYYKWRFKERKKALDLIKKIENLKVRPMILAHIPYILDPTQGHEIKYSYELYELMIEGWLVRESNFVPKNALRNFSENLAVDLYIKSAQRGSELVPAEELKKLADKWHISLEKWQLTGRSLLNRDAEGNYKFAHRSIMEYLYVKNYQYRSGIELTDQMKTFLREIIEAVGIEELSPDLCLFCFENENNSLQKKLIFGKQLGKSGDPRFHSNYWFLPDDPLLGFIEIPAGKFLMGSDSKKDKEARDNEKPQHSLYLEQFYISKYPVTVMQFNTFIESTGKEVRSGGKEEGNHPVVNVSWFEALEYCQWLTKQLKNNKECLEKFSSLFQTNDWHVTLPSEAEWEKAARGTDGRIYPWGNTFDGNNLNYDGTNIKDTSPVGCFKNGSSPYQVMEMSGNVWEWTRSINANYPYKPTESRENLQDNKGARVVRGGCWLNSARNCRVACRRRGTPDYRYGDIGFRLCLSPRLASKS
ncbi:Sulphatase-modifying factor domain protein [Candidatus Magnetomorum sp. HK-1]|nr:Sulphatase-modifying factor domain protein [Candidatus Magnetomorum sp. HK-1]